MIFISHKNDSDHVYALKIAQILGQHGIGYWLAPESIEAGADYAEEIPQAINTCELFVLILSEQTKSSLHVRKEIDLAISYRKEIIPLKVSDFELDDTITYLLANVQIKEFHFAPEEISDFLERCRLSQQIVDMVISKNPRRRLTIMKSDFQDNLAYMIENKPDELIQTVFAMGIDCSSRLDISSNSGILKWVCLYLKDAFGITTDILQEYVNKAKMEQLSHSTPYENMNYKDSVLIQIPIRSKTADSQ